MVEYLACQHSFTSLDTVLEYRQIAPNVAFSNPGSAWFALTSTYTKISNLSMRTSTKPFLYGVHWFNVGTTVTEDELLRWLPALYAQGVRMLDLPAGMIDPGLDHRRLGQILADGDMEARFCVFHVGYDCLDRKEGFARGMKAVSHAAHLASQLYDDSSYGGKFEQRPSLTGPFVGSIGVDYAFRKDRQDAARDFMRDMADILREKRVVGNLEVIRPPENRVFPGLLAALDMILEPGIEHGRILLHADTFHMQLWGEMDEETFRQIGPYVGHFHASGRLRQTPGHGMDNIPWKEVMGWAKQHFTHPELRFVTLEGFCPAFRQLVPAIGGEFPKDLEAMEGVEKAYQTLEMADAFA